MNKIKYTEDIINKYYSKMLSAKDAWYKLTNLESTDVSAKKYLWAINKFINNRMNFDDNEVQSEVPKNKKIEVTVEQCIDNSGRKTYTYKSEMLIVLNSTDNKTPEDIMKLHGYDPVQWELLKHTNKSWNGTSKLQGTYTMFSSVIHVKPIQSDIDYNNIVNIFKDLQKFNNEERVNSIKHKIDKQVNDKYLLELPIMDLHLGKISNKEETGHEYNTDIASKLYIDAVIDLVDRSVMTYDWFEECIFPIGQDFYHIDNNKNQTTKGTQLEADKRWHEIFKTGCEITITAIEYLKKYSNIIRVPYISANHDLQFSYFLTQMLDAYYKDDDKVIVESQIYPRKYFKFGNCMIGYLHNIANKSVDKIMQAEAPQIWGETKYRELHAAHLHIEELKEFAGFKFRRVPSLTATDDWHVNKGFVKTQRQAQCFIWQHQKGLLEIKNYNL